MRNTQIYADLLTEHLTNRKKKRTPEDYHDHPRYPFTPRYVVEMLDDALRLVQRENPSATFKDVLRADRSASGHVDYFDKMCLYLSEIETQKQSDAAHV